VTITNAYLSAKSWIIYYFDSGVAVFFNEFWLQNKMRYALRVRYENVQFTFSIHKSDVDLRKEEHDNLQELKSSTSHDVTSTSHTLLLLVTADQLHLRLDII